jgi:hypothetical protein
MPILPSLSGKDVARVFRGFGWRVTRPAGQSYRSGKSGRDGHSLSAQSQRSCQRDAEKPYAGFRSLTVDEFLAAISNK